MAGTPVAEQDRRRPQLWIYAARVPNDVSWEVIVDAGPHELAGLSPRPTSTRGNKVATWVFGPTDRPVEVDADVELDVRQRLTLNVETGRWSIAQPLGWGLGHAAFFLVVLLVLRSSLPPPVRARRRLAAYCAFVCAVISAAWAGSILISEQSSEVVGTGAFHRLSIAVSAVATLPLACFGRGTIVLGRRGLQWRLPVLALLGVWLAAASFFTWLLAARQVADSPDPAKLPWKLGHTMPSVLAVALVASTAAFTWLFLAIALRVVWTRRSVKRLPRFAPAALLVLVVGCVAQWVGWAWTSADAAGEQCRAGFFDRRPDRLASSLEWPALIYSIDLGTIADALLVVIGYGIAVHWLRLQARRTDTNVFVPGARSRLLLVAMLAVTLGTPGDVLLGVRYRLGCL